MSDVALLIIGLLLLGLALAVAALIRLRAGMVDEAARETLELLRERQIAEDRGALRSLPPTVAADEAITYAAKLGISVEEAAGQIFVARARALLAARMRTATRRRRRP